MITPADLARMLRQTPDSADNRTQDQLLYTSETPRHSADSAADAHDGTPASAAQSPSAESDDADARAAAAPVSAARSDARNDRPSASRSSSDSFVDSSPAAASPRPQAPVMPTPATVFGMRAMVTIATDNGTIAGQSDGIVAEAGAEAIVAPHAAGSAAVVSDSVENPIAAAGLPVPPESPELPESQATAAAEQAEPSGPTPASVFGRRGQNARGSHPGQNGHSNGQNGGRRGNRKGTNPAARIAAAAAAARLAGSSQDTRPAVPAPPQPSVPSGPTPAMMPQRRTSDGPTTFASLDAQELPVVREYSAGGLIFDDQNRVAIIARHSRSGHLEWCLPKGHIEKGETPQQTAVREVHEETGILGEVIDSIATIDYWFTGTTQRVHKLVHHFALRQTGGELTVEGDPDHEAEDAIWVRFDDLDDVLSYPNERKIAWLYARKKNRQANE
ncbi:NUDIX domain-containing protein [Bifidobacterium sp. SO4]|nr:NUDIX domain-containing protein [Bifidobacterium sp. SO4]